MDSNDEFREVDVKNRACYYFDDIIKTEDSNVIWQNTSYELRVKILEA